MNDVYMAQPPNIVINTEYFKSHIDPPFYFFFVTLHFFNTELLHQVIH